MIVGKLLQLAALAALLWPAAALAEGPTPSTDDRACAQCHSGVVEARKVTVDVHKDLSCNDCHPGRGNPHVTPALDADLGAIADSMRDEQPAIRPDTLAACTKCHAKETNEWWGSAHGPQSEGEVHGEQPSCLTCHGDPHNMPESFSAKMDIVVQCAQCHGFAGEEGKPDTNPHVVDTFRDTIHGRLLRLGNEDSAGCTDCHGVHDIRGEDDPKSMVFPANKANTCGQCHEGASASFTSAVSHKPPTVDHDFWAWIFTLFFSILTFGTIGLLIVHVALDLFRSLRPGAHDTHRGGKQPAAPLHRDDEVKRFDIHARIQHWGMMSSFTTLVITGWPLKAAAVGQSSGLMDAMGGPAVVGLIHRIAGGVLLAVAVYHVAYLIVGIKRKTMSLSMIPGPKDLADLIGNLKYLLGLQKERPKFGRFTYYEKFDYWAVFWGMFIMGLSGLMLWFPVAFSSVLPGEAIELGRIAHSDEALLAALAIFLWHFYNVHLRPTIFPMSWVWLTGRISAEALYHEHRAEYIKRYGDVPPAELEGEKPWHRRAAWSVIGLVAVLGIGVGIALADMDSMKERIDKLVSPPPVPTAVITPAADAKAPKLEAVSRPADPWSDCMTCHDQSQYDEGELFPHKDHFDDYFEDEIDDPKCSLCHEQAWHETKPLKLSVCTDCHDKDELEILKPPEPEGGDEGDEGDEPAEEPIAASGKDVFIAAKCAKCHSVEAKGVAADDPDKNKKDLSKVEGDAAGLTSFLEKASTRANQDGEDKKHPKAYKGRAENMKLLVDFLLGAGE